MYWIISFSLALLNNSSASDAVGIISIPKSLILL